METTFLPVQATENLSGHTSEENSDYRLTLNNYSQQSQGYKRLIHLRNGLSLLIRNYNLQEPLVEELECKTSSSELEFGFNLTGSLSGSEVIPTVDHSFLYFGETEPTRRIKEWQPGQRVLKVDLHLRKPSGQDFSPQQLALISPNLRDLILNPDRDVGFDLGSITPKLKLIIQQILNCPYSGQLEKIYLESKALELIVIQSARVSELDLNQQQFPALKPRDIDCIYQARETLTQNMCNPPSLLDLAHQVGLNDCTLKRGFRACFGTTVFGYLRQQRLHQAKELLLESDLNIAQVASAVGYFHAGYFASAFKREFGVTPKALRKGSIELIRK